MADKLSYQQAGVDIDEADRLIADIKVAARNTMRPEVLKGIGGFGALFEVPIDRYRKPILVSGTDGVGTKLKLAIDWNMHQGIGIDLVAMCVNDILTLGAEPLYFLDYYATGQLNRHIASAVIHSIAEGCQQANMSLIGGETAEMPGMYHQQDYDLAGFCVGVVEKDEIIDGPQRIKDGDVILGLAASGPHANGFSLIRKVLEVSATPADHQIAGRALKDWLMAPTKIYVASIRQLLQSCRVHGLAHITGGGLIENIPRILPEHTQAIIQTNAWPVPEIFPWLASAGNIEQQEMLRVFNMGIGMVVIIDAKDVGAATDILTAAGETVFTIGHITTSSSSKASVRFS